MEELHDIRVVGVTRSKVCQPEARFRQFVHVRSELPGCTPPADVIVPVGRISEPAGRHAFGITVPHRSLTTWGRMGRSDVMAEVVEACDPDDDLLTGLDAVPPPLPADCSG